MTRDHVSRAVRQLRTKHPCYASLAQIQSMLLRYRLQSFAPTSHRGTCGLLFGLHDSDVRRVSGLEECNSIRILQSVDVRFARVEIRSATCLWSHDPMCECRERTADATSREGILDTSPRTSSDPETQVKMRNDRELFSLLSRNESRHSTLLAI